MTAVTVLSSETVADLATPAEYVDAVREAYIDRGQGAPAKPRTTLRNEEPKGMLTTYGAVLPSIGAMGGYMYSAGFGAGDAWFVTPLFDAESGELLSLVDGAAMNPYKTGAAGGVAVDALSRDDATSVAVFGSGPQARGQLKATAVVRDLETVRVFSPTPDHREQFAREMDSYLDASVTAVEDSETAVREADIVITSTTSPEPVFEGEHLSEGAHVTAMGQYHPEKNELPPELVARATYVPDLRARATQDAGSYLAAVEAGLIAEGEGIAADLGEVVAGDHPGRTSDEEVTVFDSGGSGVETVAAAYMLYKRASEKGRGQTIDFAPASEALTGE